MSRLFPVFFLSLLLAQPGLTQTIYRCGSSYSERPCADGQAGQQIQAADPRSEQQRQAHEASVQREKHAAEQLEKERLKQEAAAARAAQQADRAQRAAERRTAQSGNERRKSVSQRAQDRLPAYNAPVQPRK
jgi:hypothetical protein